MYLKSPVNILNSGLYLKVFISTFKDVWNPIKDPPSLTLLLTCQKKIFNNFVHSYVDFLISNRTYIVYHEFKINLYNYTLW